MEISGGNESQLMFVLSFALKFVSYCLMVSEYLNDFKFVVATLHSLTMLISFLQIIAAVVDGIHGSFVLFDCGMLFLLGSVLVIVILFLHLTLVLVVHVLVLCLISLCLCGPLVVMFPKYVAYLSHLRSLWSKLELNYYNLLFLLVGS